MMGVTIVMDNIIYFKSSVNKQLAYLLGLIWADGSLSHNTLTLECKSEDMVDFIPILSQVFPFKYKERQRYKSGEKFGKLQTSAYFSNKGLADFLKKMDFKQKSKVSPSKILSHIPKEYHHNFWHGFFDGDGSISFCQRGCPRFNVTGSVEYEWSSLRDVLDSLEIKYTERKINCPKHYSSEIRCSRSNDIVKFREYLYRGERFGLKRKYDKFMMVKEVEEKESSSSYKYISKVESLNRWRCRFPHNGKRLCREFRSESEAVLYRNTYCPEFQQK